MNCKQRSVKAEEGLKPQTIVFHDVLSCRRGREKGASLRCGIQIRTPKGLCFAVLLRFRIFPSTLPW